MKGNYYANYFFMIIIDVYGVCVAMKQNHAQTLADIHFKGYFLY
ncbi:hypothetical protein bcere0025_59240 [Bacillus cereus F65185]|nr:hypothetical protein bcere0025_59240 [Bacillus cereus F65185]